MQILMDIFYFYLFLFLEFNEGGGGLWTKVMSKKQLHLQSFFKSSKQRLSKTVKWPKQVIASLALWLV